MSRYERSQYLETLCGLREWYLAAPADDRRATLSIEDAINYAEAVMVALEVGGQETSGQPAASFEDLPASVSDPRD
jgi:hypothetical protein